MSATRAKKRHQEQHHRASFWRGITLDTDTRLRVGRAIGKTEEQVARNLMVQLKDRGIRMRHRRWRRMGKASITKRWSRPGARYPNTVAWGRPPTVKRPQPKWQYLQVVKTHSGSRLIGITIKVIDGDPETVPDVVGAHTTYGEHGTIWA